MESTLGAGVIESRRRVASVTAHPEPTGRSSAGERLVPTLGGPRGGIAGIDDAPLVDNILTALRTGRRRAMATIAKDNQVVPRQRVHRRAGNQRRLVDLLSNHPDSYAPYPWLRWQHPSES